MVTTLVRVQLLDPDYRAFARCAQNVADGSYSTIQLLLHANFNTSQQHQKNKEALSSSTHMTTERCAQQAVACKPHGMRNNREHHTNRYGRHIMAMKDTIAQIREEQDLTQEQMARKLYVTRQAVSRWETGETAPSIDMVKLICTTFQVPLERFFDMPLEYYCQCCSMPIPQPELHGTEADGSPSENYCKYCYQQGDFTAKGVDMDEFIEATAQMEADAMGISREEAVSLMATLLPHLKRWA